MYDGEIFALLGSYYSSYENFLDFLARLCNTFVYKIGHNGAGKTTTISCCIGMMAPTSGTAVINNYDIRTDMDLVREQLGLCPQHNLLFDELTVDEHLTFFGKLKGLGHEEAKQERVEMLKKLQLTEKTDTLASALSGGQKRKLCLGISLIGKAKVVFLDGIIFSSFIYTRRKVVLLLTVVGRIYVNNFKISQNPLVEWMWKLGELFGIYY